MALCSLPTLWYTSTYKLLAFVGIAWGFLSRTGVQGTGVGPFLLLGDSLAPHGDEEEDEDDLDEDQVNTILGLSG